jgi:hypothetical protein
MSTTVSSHQRPDVLNKWLARHGFTANPFAIREAGHETLLSEYFVEGPYYREILGTADNPCTCLVFAARGCGKTAYRVMIQNACRPTARDSFITTVPYIDFHYVLAEVGDDLSEVTLDHHLRAILAVGLTTLFHEFLESPESFFRLPWNRKGILKWLIEEHAPLLLHPTFLSDRLREWGREAEADHLEELADKGPLSEVLAMTSDSLFRHFLHPFISTSPEPSVKEMPLIEHWRAFVGLVQRIGLKAVYVLVDGLDEFSEIAIAPQTAVTTFLTPLVANLYLLETPPVAFKFFLPLELLEALRKNSAVRFDRLKQYHLEWQHDHLVQMLRGRLQAFSQGRVSSLDATADVSVAGRVDAQLVRWARGSPRNLLLLGDTLLTISCERKEGPQLLLSEEALQEVPDRFEQEYGQLVPSLNIDEKQQKVLIGGRVIREKLSPLEYNLLLFLYQNTEEVKSKDDIYLAVYQTTEGISDEAIDSLVFRLRKKIEPDPKRPVYLITKRGKGYRLQNTQ